MAKPQERVCFSWKFPLEYCEVLKENSHHRFFFSHIAEKLVLRAMKIKLFRRFCAESQSKPEKKKFYTSVCKNLSAFKVRSLAFFLHICADTLNSARFKFVETYDNDNGKQIEGFEASPEVIG